LLWGCTRKDRRVTCPVLSSNNNSYSVGSD